MASGVARIIFRCEEAMQTQNLDLSDCQMVHIAEGVYHIMKDTEVKTLNVSGNVLTKVSPRLVVKFSLLRDLDISRNQIGTLPNDLAFLLHLERLNISSNCFTEIPECVFRLPALRELDASKNRITDIDNDDLKNAACLSSVDLTENPLTKRCIENLPKTGITFIHSPPSEEQEDWEDLNI
ncbi:leucine-rich repeat-containing protein 20-like [Harmonia axyridis]|uniref:leucine-rich repeat-containing protein 20-like n=1 Tax=Harmonia axyridis TaxID=115357 RepID=UPI001E278C26|nr:leucine-rich repeat-containing protein 20-like [Harmonia axyridis]